MSKVLWVAWREFKHTALTKAFIIGTIIFPLLIWGGMIAGSMFAQPSVATLSGELAIIDPSGAVIDAARAELDTERASAGPDRAPTEIGEVDPEQLADEARSAAPFGTITRLDLTIAGFDDPERAEALRDAVRRGEYVGLAVIDREVLDHEPGRATQRRVQLYVPDGANPDHTAAIRRGLSRAVVRARADRAGLDIDEIQRMLSQPAIDSRRLTADGEAAAGVEIQKLLPIAFMVLLWISAFASGNYLLTTTIEEKSNKVMEVLLSAVSPMQLMAGKIFGQAVVGMFTVMVYGALGFAALTMLAMGDLITVAQIVYLIVYFLMAYFMIAAIMAGIGSMVSDMQEAHALITPAMLVLFIPLILLMPISQNPNGTLATVTTFIPPFTPFVMIVRVTASEPIPIWQIPASLVVGAGGVVLLIWLCARIFRIGVLMQGKPPNPLELLRWLRYS